MKKLFWAGFVNGHIAGTRELYSEDNILAIYRNKRTAKSHYQDVRQVRIIEVKKKSKSK